jgi:hypothetical protein
MIAFYGGGGGIDMVQGYCIKFKMKFETKKMISVKTRKTGLFHFQSSSRLIIKEEEAFSNCPVRP